MAKTQDQIRDEIIANINLQTIDILVGQLIAAKMEIESLKTRLLPVKTADTSKLNPSP